MDRIKVKSSVDYRHLFRGMSVKMKLTPEEYIKFVISQSNEFSDDEGFMKKIFCKAIYLSRGGIFRIGELINSLDYKQNGIRTCITSLVKRGLLENVSWGVYRVLRYDIDDSYKGIEYINVDLKASVIR